jgi:hypothetical protein
MPEHSMQTPASQILINLFQNNHNILHLQVRDVTHTESLIQPPFRGNCLNWVVGHVLVVYGECLEAIGLPNTASEEEVKLYGYGSQPITDPARACDLDDLLKRLDNALPILLGALGSLSAEELERPVQIWRGKVSLLEALSFMQWHSAFHTGQLELLRQLTGKNDKVI